MIKEKVSPKLVLAVFFTHFDNQLPLSWMVSDLRLNQVVDPATSVMRAILRGVIISLKSSKHREKLVKPIAYYLNMTDFVMSSSGKSMSLKLLVLQLAFQLLSFRHLAHRPVEVILVNSVSVVLNGKQTTVLIVRNINRKQKSKE